MTVNNPGNAATPGTPGTPSNPINPDSPEQVDGAGSRVDMLLVQRLHRQVGQGLQVEQARRKTHGLLGLVGESERQYARKLIADAITEHVETLLNRGESPLPHDVEHAPTRTCGRLG